MIEGGRLGNESERRQKMCEVIIFPSVFSGALRIVRSVVPFRGPHKEAAEDIRQINLILLLLRGNNNKLI